jgi:shikimate dehydrogenase
MQTAAELWLIGDPVAHSRSPAMQNAALAVLGIAWQYHARHTPAGELAARIAALRAGAAHGANVTLPHKEAVLPLLDSIDAAAARIGAVNTIIRRTDGRLYGTNTDAPGLLSDLAAGGMQPAGARVVLLGASGAARAALVACADAGAAQLAVVNRGLERAQRLQHELAAVDVRIDQVCSTGDDELPALIAGADLIINATPLGWHDGEHPLPGIALPAGSFVYDMVYRTTALLQAAAAAGARGRDGRGMLIEQGALALEQWSGRPVPRDVMWRAAFDCEPPL